MTRAVTTVVCDGDGHVLGTLPPFDLATPWWQDTEPVVDHLRARHGIRAVVLRLLTTDDPWPPHGGAVTYLVEATGELPASAPLSPAPIEDGLADHPLRASWARPGGVGRLLAWAEEHVERTGPAAQVRTWNLSCLLRFPTARGAVWLKAVPPFFAHEGAALHAFCSTHPDLVPVVLAHAPGVALLDHIDGDDLYDEHDRFPSMVRRLVDLQVAWAARVDELLALGVPDRRAAALGPALQTLVARPDVRAPLTRDERTALDRVTADVPGRLVAAAGCGIPGSVVHGDFHPGNWRGRAAGSEVVIDWGDCVVGNPLLEMAWRDGPARDACAAAWLAAVPGSDPARGLDLLAPVSCLYPALVYQRFLDNIESSEHCYHRHDPEEWLRRAIAYDKASTT